MLLFPLIRRKCENAQKQIDGNVLDVCDDDRAIRLYTCMNEDMGVDGRANM